MFDIRLIKSVDYKKGYFELLKQSTKSFSEHVLVKPFVYVVEENNKIIGTGALYIGKHMAERFLIVGYIEDVFIDSEYKNTSLKKDLVEFLIQLAIEKKCNKLKLDFQD